MIVLDTKVINHSSPWSILLTTRFSPLADRTNSKFRARWSCEPIACDPQQHQIADQVEHDIFARGCTTRDA
jgi:hypothetical protein